MPTSMAVIREWVTNRVKAAAVRKRSMKNPKIRRAVGGYVCVSHPRVESPVIPTRSDVMFLSFFTCDISNCMIRLFRQPVAYSKGIIFLLIITLFVAQLSVHRFDPFHPKAVTNDCIQTTVTLLEKKRWLILVGVLVAAFFRRGFCGENFLMASQLDDVRHGVGVFLLFDPIKRALREGRLRRLIYH